MTTFAHNVQKLLDEYGWTHKNLADALGMHQTHISRTLRGEHSPRVSLIERTAKVLEVPVKSLLEPIPQKTKKRVDRPKMV